DPDPELRLELALQLCVQPGELLAELVSRTRRTQRVVLVHHRYPKDGHDGVADELLHGPAVALEHLARHGEVTLHHTSQRLGVETFAERSRAGDVAEEDRHDLPQLPSLGGGKRRAAGGAEPRRPPTV